MDVHGTTVTTTPVSPSETKQVLYVETGRQRFPDTVERPVKEGSSFRDSGLSRQHEDHVAGPREVQIVARQFIDATDHSIRETTSCGIELHVRSNHLRRAAKGGSGKTTVVVSLATAFLSKGKTVALLDTDPQGSLGKWFDMREERLGENPHLHFSTATPWGISRELRSLRKVADYILVD
ncbi:MAG: AAA family ATPase, partial [Gammaproteobacteria bacterium]